MFREVIFYPGFGPYSGNKTYIGKIAFQYVVKKSQNCHMQIHQNKYNFLKNH